MRCHQPPLRPDRRDTLARDGRLGDAPGPTRTPSGSCQPSVRHRGHSEHATRNVVSPPEAGGGVPHELLRGSVAWPRETHGDHLSDKWPSQGPRCKFMGSLTPWR